MMLSQCCAVGGADEGETEAPRSVSAHPFSKEPSDGDSRL